jgi:phage shock protein E
MNILKQLFGGSPKVDLESVIQKGAFLVDVRTPGEFASGHVKGSVNIPLDSIPTQLAKFKNKKNIIVFCQSGGRSSQAKSLLEKNGVENVINGGGWTNVNQYVR